MESVTYVTNFFHTVGSQRCAHERSCITPLLYKDARSPVGCRCTCPTHWRQLAKLRVVDPKNYEQWNRQNLKRYLNFYFIFYTKSPFVFRTVGTCHVPLWFHKRVCTLVVWAAAFTGCKAGRNDDRRNRGVPHRQGVNSAQHLNVTSRSLLSDVQRNSERKKSVQRNIILNQYVKKLGGGIWAIPVKTSSK